MAEFKAETSKRGEFTRPDRHHPGQAGPQCGHSRVCARGPSDKSVRSNVVTFERWSYAVAGRGRASISELQAPPARQPRGCPWWYAHSGQRCLQAGRHYLSRPHGDSPDPVSRPLRDGVATFYTKLRTEQAPPIRTLCADLPEGFAAVIDRCLLRDPLDRYQNAAAMLDDLVRHRE